MRVREEQRLPRQRGRDERSHHGPLRAKQYSSTSVYRNSVENMGSALHAVGFEWVLLAVMLLRETGTDIFSRYWIVVMFMFGVWTLCLRGIRLSQGSRACTTRVLWLR